MVCVECFAESYAKLGKFGERCSFNFNTERQSFGKLRTSYY